MNTQTTQEAEMNTTPAPFTAGEALRYTGEAHVAPVNRTITAPYGAFRDVVAFREYVSPERAEVLTTRGSRIVNVRHLTRP